MEGEKKSVFGQFAYPCRFRDEEFSFCIEWDGAFSRYTRKCGGEQFEKILASPEGILFVQPVEPINLPKEVTRYLEIEFPSVLVEPESSQKIYLTFPIEIGIFLKARDDYELLDVFSSCTPKYSLYGTPEAGVITRNHESRVFAGIPETNPICEGVLELEIRNMSRGWVNVSRVVLETYFMHLYYGKITAMVGEMVLYSRQMAETRIVNRPLLAGMELAIPVIQARKILMVNVDMPGFLMEYGVE